MASEWQSFSLLDIYDIRSGLSKPAKDFGSGFPFLSFKDVFYNFFTPAELSQQVQSSEKERESCSVKRGDVFLTRTSETMHELGMSCVALKDYEQATFNGFCKRLRPKSQSTAVPEYVGYYLRSPKFRNEMMAFSTMSTRASLNNEMIGRLTITLPPEKEQRSIAHVLKTLDDKIQLNRQTNQTLEAMAQALFKSWFVDFDPVIDNALAAGHEIPPELQARAEARKSLQARAEQRQASLSGDRSEQESGDILRESIRQLFPNRFVLDAQMGWIPEGWEVKPVGQVIDNVGGGTPRTNEMAFWNGGIHSFCTPKDMSLLTSKTLLATERHLTDAGVAKISSGQLPQGTVLMSSRAPIGYLAISDIPVSVNQGVIAMKPTGAFSSEFILSWVEVNMDEVVTRANGSTFLEISKKNFREIPFLMPNNEVLQQYDNIVKPYFSRITNIQKEVDQLAKLRDTLLPKLISGELRLPDEQQPAKTVTA